MTHSTDALITDSASSATAFSAGQKTKNGALGVDPENKNIENLTETLDKYGLHLMLNQGAIVMKLVCKW